MSNHGLPHPSERRNYDQPLKVVDPSKLLAGVCARCKRREIDGHDSWCPQTGQEVIETPGPGETVTTIVRGSASMDAVDAPVVRPVTVYANRAARGIPTQAIQRKEKAVPTEPELYPCARCNVDQVADAFQRRSRDGGPKTICKTCMQAAMIAGRLDKAGKGSPAKAPVDQVSYSLAHAVADLGIELPEPAPQVVTPPSVPVYDPSLEQPKPEPPNYDQVLAALQAERSTVLATINHHEARLEQLDADIADLQAVTDLADKPIDELQRMERWVKMALQMRGAA